MLSNVASNETQDVEIRRRERRLTFVALLLSLSIGYFAVTSLVVLVYKTSLTPHSQPWLLWMQRKVRNRWFIDTLLLYINPIVEFIFNYSNPYTLLLLSTVVRETFKRFYHLGKLPCCKKTNTI